MRRPTSSASSLIEKFCEHDLRPLFDLSIVFLFTRILHLINTAPLVKVLYSSETKCVASISGIYCLLVDVPQSESFSSYSGQLSQDSTMVR